VAAHTFPSGSPHEAILALERRRHRALIDWDAAALGDLFADDLTHVHTSGVMHTKRELLAYLEARVRFVAIERHGVEVRVYDDVALMTGGMVSQMRNPQTGEQVTMHAFVTQVLRRFDGRWRFCAFHACGKLSTDHS
jgi:uncharacterized protein (TIGR02246 family)